MNYLIPLPKLQPRESKQMAEIHEMVVLSRLLVKTEPKK